MAASPSTDRPTGCRKILRPLSVDHRPPRSSGPRRPAGWRRPAKSASIPPHTPLPAGSKCPISPTKTTSANSSNSSSPCEPAGRTPILAASRTGMTLETWLDFFQSAGAKKKVPPRSAAPSGRLPSLELIGSAPPAQRFRRQPAQPRSPPDFSAMRRLGALSALTASDTK